MGRPIITSTQAGCRDSISDGTSGLLVPPRNPRILADVMLRFVREPNLLERFGAAAAAEAARRYDALQQDARLADLLFGHPPVPATPA